MCPGRVLATDFVIVIVPSAVRFRSRFFEIVLTTLLVPVFVLMAVSKQYTVAAREGVTSTTTVISSILSRVSRNYLDCLDHISHRRVGEKKRKRDLDSKRNVYQLTNNQ